MMKNKKITKNLNNLRDYKNLFFFVNLTVSLSTLNLNGYLKAVCDVIRKRSERVLCFEKVLFSQHFPVTE